MVGNPAAARRAYICVAVIQLLAAFVFLYCSTRSLETGQQMERSMSVLAQFHRLALDAVRVEVAELHYLSNGHTEFLAEAHSALAAIQATLEAAEITAPLDDIHQQRLDAVGEIGDTIADYLASTRGRPASIDGPDSLPSGLRKIAAESVAGELADLVTLRAEHDAWERKAYLSFGAEIVLLTASLLFMHRSWPAVRRGGQGQSNQWERATELENTNVLLMKENVERMRAQKALGASRETLRQLYARQEAVREQERKRMAREVHDGLGQDLYALKIAISQLDRHAAGQHTQLRDGIAQALDQMDGLIASVRTVIYNLRPEVLDLGLIPAARWQTREFEKRSGIRCNFACTPTQCQLPEEVSMALFRILQEALTNVMRHAEATEVTVTLVETANAIVLRIADDGRGFASIVSGGGRAGFGLAGMRERALGIGGQLDIASAPGRGTALTVNVPCAD